MFKFEILKKDKNSKARVGLATTSHGSFETPCFVPVATQASLKAISSEDAKLCGVDIIISNTYHLHLRPGEDLVAKMGGLHKFMNWDRPIMTDSGGFQVFSLGFGIEHGVGKIANIFPDETSAYLEKRKEWSSQAKLAKVTDDGVMFKSHIDGKMLELTPKISMQVQKKLGADIVLAFDECTSPLSDLKYTAMALKRTHNWAKICLSEKNNKQALYGIIQGGAFEDLRKESSEFINSLDFDGFAVGGSLGRSKADMLKVLDWTLPILNENKPRHLLGIGEFSDIFNIVNKGIDTFDCVMPTRLGRMGRGMTFKGHIDILKNIYSKDKRPIEEGCCCYACQNYSRAYLNHLFRTKELLGYRLLTMHNLYFINNLVAKIREAIKKGKYGRFWRF